MLPSSRRLAPAAAEVPAPLRLPLVESEFARRLHPYWPQLRENNRHWLLEKRLMPRHKVEAYANELRYTDLMAGYYLGAQDEVLQAIADFSTWFFAWDDRHDRDVVHQRPVAWQQLRVALHRALESPREHVDHQDALVAGFADSVLRLFSFLGPAWNQRFTDHFRSVIEAYDEEFHNRARRTVPTVEDYLQLRRRTFAHEIWTDLLEPSAGRELPDAVREHPAFRRAALLSQDFAAWYNDLCSLPKEVAGDEVHNLGLSLIAHEGLTTGQAMAEVRRRVEWCTVEFLVAEQEVLRFADELANNPADGEALRQTVRGCVANMRNWFSAVYWFHHESARYSMDGWDDGATPPYITDGRWV